MEPDWLCPMQRGDVLSLGSDWFDPMQIGDYTSIHPISCTKDQSEENNRMGKTRDLVKKIRDNKGTFHAKMGTIKDRNGLRSRKD